MSTIAGKGCERLIPTEEKKSLEEIERSLVKKYRKHIWTKFVRAVKDYNLVEEGDKIANFKILHTPGHSKGGISLYDGKILICGDTIFANGGVGRMDIGGNPNDMKASLMRLKELDVEYLLPGHGPWVNNGKEHIKMSCMMMGIK